MKAKLDAAEKSIERAAGSYRPVAGKDRKRIETILEHSRKSRNINIRIAEPTLAELKRRAEEEGLPYQTLISSILHKYVMNRLVDQDAVAKSLRFLRSNQ
jgi:predicted DNA binding CopG/RHH family protein